MNAKTDPAASDDPAASSQDARHPVPPPTNPHFALFVATAGGLGYLPKAPGTWGSLAGLALAVLPAWILFASEAIFKAAKHSNAGVFLQIPAWYCDPLLWAQIVVVLIIAGLVSGLPIVSPSASVKKIPSM